MAEQRRLRRVENRFGTDLICRVFAPDCEIECSVLDFNSLGLRLACKNSDDFNSLITNELFDAKIMYGNRQMGSFSMPKVLRTLGSDLELILISASKEADLGNEREERADVPELLEPLITGRDPARINETLIMRVSNLSSNGFRAKCSLSNRHLFQGQIFKDFTVYLPTIGEIRASFKLINLNPSDRFLNLGCQFLDFAPPDEVKLRSFLLLSLLSKNENPEMLSLRQTSKKLSKITRIRRIDSAEDFAEVMKLRFEAYSGASKLIENATVSDMTDEYDANSIILGAFMGKKLAGTIRIVFSNKGSKFPFEKYFQFPVGIKNLRPENCVEVSKLAIDPLLQGSDVLFRLFQTVAIEFVPKRENALLMSTDALARNYIAIGAQKISHSIFHPVLTSEKMSLYVIETNHLKNAKISALAWVFFGREIQNFMITFGFMTKTKLAFLKFLKLPIEIAPKLIRKIYRKLTNKPRR